MNAVRDNDASLTLFGETLMIGIKLKKIMFKRGINRCRCKCPRCDGMINAAMVGPKDHLRMSCSGSCGMAMME